MASAPWAASPAARARGQGAERLPHFPADVSSMPAIASEAGEPRALVLDWAGYRAAVSYTFDDSNSSQIENYARLSALGVPLTFYLWTSKPESRNPIWAQALREGHELGNHSHSHRPTGDPATLAEDLDRASDFIQEHFGVRPWTMAAPYGSRDYVPAVQERFFINRGVSEGLVLPLDGSNPHYLDCFVPQADAPAADFERRLQAARERRGWEIVLIHGFRGGSDQAYQPSSLEAFEQAVRAAKSQGDVWIGTLMDVGAYWLGQKAFAEATRQVTSEGVTYRWELPEHFPPRKFLRVRVSGSSATQAGQPVLEVAPGVFDISLDSKELTLAS